MLTLARQPDEIDLTCFRVLHLARWLAMWDLCPSSDHRLHQEDLINLVIHCPKKMQTMNILRMLIVLVHICVGDATPFSSSIKSAATSIGQEQMCAYSWWRYSMCYLEYERLIGSPTSSQLCREQKHISFTRLAENNDVIFLQEVHGKDEFFQANQILVPQFRLFGTLKPNNLNAGGSAICIHRNLFFDGNVISHVITCQGRERKMSFSSLTWLWGAFVNDYALFFHIGPGTLEHLGLWLEISTRFNVWNQTFTDGDAGKTAVFLFFIARLWDCTAGLHKEGCYSQWCNTYLSRIDRIFVNLPVAEARDFPCYSHVFENLGERSIPWLHRFKLPNFAGNLSPLLRKEGEHKESKNGEREREHMEMTLSIHWRMTHGLSVSHTSHSITRNTPSF